jgi:monofunctional glycosyltransferase
MLGIHGVSDGGKLRVGQEACVLPLQVGESGSIRRNPGKGILGLNGLFVKPEPDREAIRPRKRKQRRSFRARLFRTVLISTFAIILTPLALSVLYTAPFVQPVSTLMVRDLALLRGYDRQWVAIEDMAPVLLHSVMMSEDGQFCSHRGIDWAALNMVIDDALQGEPTRGASTIPMQTVKNLFLWHGRSFVRKAVEVPLALFFDAVVPKRRIMEIYLNIAEWGPGVYGAEAAAQRHFGKSARDLSRSEAALLAVTLPNPRIRNPARPTAGMQRLAATIERRARQAGGYIGCLS